MKIKEILKDITIVGMALVIFTLIFMGAILQTSYRYCPPSQEEIEQMSIVERWIYGK